MALPIPLAILGNPCTFALLVCARQECDVSASDAFLGLSQKSMRPGQVLPRGTALGVRLPLSSHQAIGLQLPLSF